MNPVLPAPLVDLIDSLRQLPGVGPRTAERYAYWLLKNDAAAAGELSEQLRVLHSRVTLCPKTFALMEAGQAVSPLYSDSRRDKKLIAVVAEPLDVVALEKTGNFNGTYHVLGGLVSPIDNVGPEQLHIAELVERVKQDKVSEIILATNASVEGESTALLITQALSAKPVKITRLARGLPVGVDLEYADQITLSKALEGRQTF